jgi:hypothetical protein
LDLIDSCGEILDPLPFVPRLDVSAAAAAAVAL